MSREVTAKGMNVTVTAPNNLLIKTVPVTNVTVNDTDADLQYAALTTSKTVDNIGKIYPSSSIDGAALFAIKDGSAVNATGAANGSRMATTELVDATAKGAKYDTANTKAVDGAYVDFKYNIKTQGSAAVDVVVRGFNVTLKTGTATAEQKKALNSVRAAILDDNGAVITGKKSVLYNTVATDGIADLTAANARYWTANSAIAKITGDNGKTGGEKVDYTSTSPLLSAVNFATISKTTTLTTDAVLQAPNSEAGLTFTLRVWIEGEDKECIVENASALNFNVELILADAAYVATP